jgi:hypothetical protein
MNAMVVAGSDQTFCGPRVCMVKWSSSISSFIPSISLAAKPRVVSLLLHRPALANRRHKVRERERERARAVRLCGGWRGAVRGNDGWFCEDDVYPSKQERHRLCAQR